jgi:hypothetical protein
MYFELFVYGMILTVKGFGKPESTCLCGSCHGHHVVVLVLMYYAYLFLIYHI